MPDNVNIAPFAARIVTQPGEYSLWWEDPRDIERIEVTFAESVNADALPKLHYWQDNWPRVHVPKNAVIGSGRQGWLPIDDWIAGHWQQAAAKVNGSGRTWEYAFESLANEDTCDCKPAPLTEATFRRTLKLRLIGKNMPAIESIAVYTGSEWREVELAIEWGGITSHKQCWDGKLAAYNGEVLAVVPLGGDVEVRADGGWASCVGAVTAGIRARVRYAYNEDNNSYDRTILTLRAREQLSFSVDVNGVADGDVIYLPDLGVAVARAEDYQGLPAIRSDWMGSLKKTTNQKVEALPEQTWARVTREQPTKAQRIYFVLGTEGGRQKARLHPNGDIEPAQNFIRRVKGKDSERLKWPGENLRVSFGLPDEKEITIRALAEGYLPIVRTVWDSKPIAYEQETLATWLLADISDDTDKQGDDTVVALSRLTLMNLSDAPTTASLTLKTSHEGAPEEKLEAENGLIYAVHEGERLLRLALDIRGRGGLHPASNNLVYEVALGPGDFHCLVAKVPFITLESLEEVIALEQLSFEEQREKVADFWRQRVAQGMQITVPNEDLNRFHRAHLTHMLIVNDREPGSDRRAPRCGGFHYGNFPDEGIMGTTDLDRRGYTKEAEQCLEIMAHYQGTVPLPGDFETQFGVLYGSNGYECGGYNRGQGWAMFGFAEHYHYTRDRAWLERVAPVLVKACDWVTYERKRTMKLNPDGSRPIAYGFLPAGSLEDVHDYWHWLSTNAYAYWGFKSIAWALGEIGHPEAMRLRAECEAFYKDLMTGFNESRVRSPVVKLADGHWVPYYPPRLERRGRDFGWLREVLEGSMNLLVAELIPLDDPAAQWILDDYEDNLYLSKRYGYPGTMPDFDESRWFDWGGFSMQSNLLLHPAVYLRRDNVKQFLRTFFNGFNSTFHADVAMCSEHDLPTLADWVGDHFKTSDEANVSHYLRLLLIEEQGDDLILGKAIPREWLEQGKTIKVERALTYFGQMGYEIRSYADQGSIEADIELPQRNSPARATLRLRHPCQEPIVRVEINGEEWPCFDAGAETVSLPLDKAAALRVKVYYK